MGASPSLARVLRAIEDDDLVNLIEDAYTLDPQRIERAFAVAKMRYLDAAKEQLARDGAIHIESDGSSASTQAAVATFSSPPPGMPSLLTSKEIGAMMSAGADDHHAVSTHHHHHHESARRVASKSDTLNVGKDPMNALWNFEGHTLRELLPLAKNPQHASANSDGDDSGVSGKQLDEQGFPLMYGSCGRDKRYARCSVCYFRGLRCNSAHYCSCCQRPVCIRPRKYPNEEHPKICWNVLHLDKDMVSRVEKKKRRRLQVAVVAASPANGSAAPSAKGDSATIATYDSSQRRPAAASAAHADMSSNSSSSTTALDL